MALHNREQSLSSGESGILHEIARQWTIRQFNLGDRDHWRQSQDHRHSTQTPHVRALSLPRSGIISVRNKKTFPTVNQERRSRSMPLVRIRHLCLRAI